MTPVYVALAFSIFSGLFLYFAGKFQTNAKRWMARVVYLVVATVLSTVIMGAALGDDFRDMLSLSPVFFVYSFEALAISVAVARYFGPLGVGKFMLVFLPAVLLLLFLSTFLLIGLYPGS